MTKLKRIVIGKKGTKFICKCLNCHINFLVKGYEFRVGRGKFYGTSCHYKFFKDKPRSFVSSWKPNKKQLKKMSEVQIGRFSGKKHWNWKGGKRTDPGGYIIIYKPDHPYPNYGKKYVYEHRLIMEKKIKRYLKPNEVVHHINKITSDNRIKNLVFFKNQSQHIALHNSLRFK